MYVIYDYELWMTETPENRARMSRTYHAEFVRIATSPAVTEMLQANQVSPDFYIPCGLNLENFRIDSPVEARAQPVIGFPVRATPGKGTADALAAMQQLKQKYGEAIRIMAFGPETAPDLPAWVEYTRFPSDAALRDFYNTLSIFVFPSHYEGWGLPGCEALACGAALVAADSVGIRDYARDGETALLTPPRCPDLLARAVERLLADDGLRQRLARQGHAKVQEYTWDRAVNAFENALLACCRRPGKENPCSSL